MHCNYCVSLLLMFAPLFNFPFLALWKGPRCLVVKQYLFCGSSSEGFSFIICGGSVCVRREGEMPSGKSVRGTVCRWMWALTSRRREGEEVEALEFSISGIINRACVWQGVLCEPRARHWEPSKPRGVRRKQLFLQKGPVCIWEARKAQTAKLGTLNFLPCR